MTKINNNNNSSIDNTIGSKDNRLPPLKLEIEKRLNIQTALTTEVDIPVNKANSHRERTTNKT